MKWPIFVSAWWPTQTRCWLEWEVLLVIDGDHVKPPCRSLGKLSVRKRTQVVANHHAQVVALLPINGGFGWFDVMRGAGLDLDETENIFVPSDEIDFSMMPRRAVVTGDYHVTFAPEIEVRVFLPPAANEKMDWNIFYALLTRNPVKYAEHGMSDAAAKHHVRLTVQWNRSL